ncbi:transposase [Cupriavidus basilensis]|uniref:transposase n=1 Tax=Cupriavidus basilensis TaxID=68895 RepID=UPI0023E81BCC|nr:transposase [Cupriavidus basilensis]MDF3886727.1 transposase [Cupriavidus basilensis]
MMERVSTAIERPRRKEYSAEFKAMVLQQAHQTGASVGGVALSHGLHPNMVHRWVREERERQMLAAQRESPTFIPLHVQPLPAAQQCAQLLRDWLR